MTREIEANLEVASSALKSTDWTVIAKPYGIGCMVVVCEAPGNTGATIRIEGRTVSMYPPTDARGYYIGRVEHVGTFRGRGWQGAMGKAIDRAARDAEFRW